MPRDYKLYLTDILESIEKIEDYAKNVSFEDLSSDEMRKDAIIRNLMIIGEAAKNIPKDIRSKSTEIEWEKISGLRDILIHQYFGADLDTLWDVIRNNLPTLKRNVQALIKKI